MAEKDRIMNNKWQIIHDDFENTSKIEHMESLFTIGNGYLGLRGNSILSDFTELEGTYINGFYEKGLIRYGEKAFGYAENWQTIIPLPVGKEIKFEINGIELFGESGRFVYQKRTLNLKESFRLWEFSWIDSAGRTYKGSVKTIVPFQFTGTVLFIWNIILPEDSSIISVESDLVFNRKDENDSDDPRLPGHFNSNSINVSYDADSQNKNQLLLEADGSGLICRSLMNHQFEGVNIEENKEVQIEDGILNHFSGRAQKKITIVKAIAYTYDHKSKFRETENTVLNELKQIQITGINKILENQELFMKGFWNDSDIVIEGDDEAQLSIRFNLFQLLQSTGRDGKRSIAAKGLSGPGYEGHYFWDAETYILPFFIYTNPKIARSMILYRISTMNEARKRAGHLGHKGILFPWRTINGEESSAYFPAGTAQYHINADIALGLSNYMKVTGDTSLLSDGGSELLAETARFWCDLGSEISGKGFCFNGVTGPDEYTALVDNNFYTNISAKENLEAAVFWLKGIVEIKEIDLWKKISSNIYFPEHSAITPQDDSFWGKEPWDFENTKDSSYPLLLHFHPLNIYRKQVLKQADVVLAQALFRNILPPGQMKRNFDFYEGITTRDSSLSACAQGINAMWFGYEKLAWEYFYETLHTDRMDLHKNVFHGLHTASMGGSYLMVINGFLGLEFFAGQIRFRPRMPGKLDRLSLKIKIKNAQLKIEMTKDHIIYNALENDVEFYHFSKKILLVEGESKELSIHPELKKDFKQLPADDFEGEKDQFVQLLKKALVPEETNLNQVFNLKEFKGFRPGK